MTRILFVGDLARHSRTWQRFTTLQEMGHDVEGLSTRPVDHEAASDVRSSWAERIGHRLGRPRDSQGVNATLETRAATGGWDVVWVEKALCLRPETLRKVRDGHPQGRFAFFSEDDMFARHNQSAYFRQCLPLYDVVFTTKSHNADPQELPALGARRVQYLRKSYDPRFHRPVDVSASQRRELGAKVGFVGTFEEPRARQLEFLAKHGVEVRVFGNGWLSWIGRHPRLCIEGRAVVGEDYIRCLSATDINLGFLRKRNRDQHTDRSVEIPACGAFLLAERSAEHQEMFVEGTEAEFFSSPQELLEKVRFYLASPERRQQLAVAGRRRCEQSHRTHEAALREMWRHVERESCVSVFQ